MGKQILYTDPIFRVKNNVWISTTCKMSRELDWVVQYQRYSLYMYLQLKFLHVTLTSNKDIDGFKIKEMKQEIKIIQHADDCTVPR